MTAVAAPSLAAVTRAQVEEFLYREAELLFFFYV